MSSYPPDRPQFYAIKYLQWLIESGASMDCGPDTMALLVAVVMMEDQLRYSRAPNFYNEQLVRAAGFGSEPPMISARKRAERLGLLVYIAGAKRRPGVYFTAGFPNDSLANVTGTRREYHTNPEGISQEPVGNVVPSIPNPIPNPRPNPKPTSTSKLRFDAADSDFAKSMFEAVLQIAPKTPKPNLDKWANAIRLMRERDGHSLDDIRRVFAWANADGFWAANILSPDKLRGQFATLDAQMRRKGSSSKTPRPQGAGVNYVANHDTSNQW